MHRRTLLKSIGGASAVGLFGVNGVLAQEDFPTESLTWMIPWSEGGGTDQYARQLAPPMEEALGQSIEIDNREGAGSMVGSAWLAEQEPDGYTFGTVNTPGWEFTWRAQEVDEFHVEDFEPISQAGVFGYTLIGHDELEIEDYGDLRDRYADGDISGFGYQGVGSDSHFITLLLREEYGLEYDTAVPYDGGGPTSEAVMSGEVAAGFATNTSAVPAVESGLANPIVNLMDIDLTETFPDIDRIDEYGESLAWVTEFWQTQVAPAGTPEEARQAISESVEAAVNDEGAQEWAEETGNILEYSDMDETAESLEGVVEELEEQADEALGGFDEFQRIVEEEG